MLGLASAPTPEDRARMEEERKALREHLLRVLLTSEARQRLNNIRMVKPELARMVEDQLIRLASEGKLNRALTDEELKKLLAALQPPKKEFRIRWV